MITTIFAFITVLFMIFLVIIAIGLIARISELEKSILSELKILNGKAASLEASGKDAAINDIKWAITTMAN